MFATNPPRTLIADDQPDVLEALRLLLKREGFQIEAATSPRAVLEKLEDRDFDLLLMDLNYALDTTSGQEGLDLLTRIQRLDSTLPVVVMTAWGSIPLAVEAMRRGARDFVEKPWENAQLLATLRAQLQARGLRRNDVDDAIAVQRNLLPRHIPQMPGCEVSVCWQPAQQVSGDYVDVVRAGERKVALAVADVIGKGVSAALMMANVQAVVRVLASESLPSGELSNRLNRTVCANLGSGKFITFFYGVIDDGQRTLTYTNAGHCAPVLVRASGDVLRLEEGGAVLGVFPDWRYQQGVVDLLPGDRLVLFTDGVTEAEIQPGEDFGEARLVDLVRENRHLPAGELQKKVTSALGRCRIEDDVTLLVAAVK